MEMPKGCTNTMQVSFIADPALRPNPFSLWLYSAENERGETTTGVATNREKAIEAAKKAMV